MKILYLAQSRIPSRTANSIHVMKMSQAFMQAGHDFELLARHAEASQAENDFNIETLYGLQRKIPIRLYSPIPFIEEYGIACQQAFYASQAKPDLVLTRDIPSAAATIALRLPTLLELHSPDMGRAKRTLFNWLIHRRYFAGLIVITHALKREMMSRYPALNDSEILVAPDAVDLERFAGLPVSSLARQNLGLHEGFTAGYAGHLYEGRGIELIMEMASVLPDIHFLIVGGNHDDVNRCRVMACNRKLHNMIFKGFIANAEVPHYLAACDVLLMPYQESVSVSGGGNTVRWMSPMKVFEYIAASRPIISSDLPSLREILSNNNAILCDCRDASQWTSAIELLRASPTTYANLCEASKEAVLKFTWCNRVKSTIKHAEEKIALSK